MAITAAEASPSDGLSYRMFAAERLDGRTQMRKTTLFAAAAALIATGFGVWAASPARVSPSIGQGIEPFLSLIHISEPTRPY